MIKVGWDLQLFGGCQDDQTSADAEGSCKATWERGFKPPWREAGPAHHPDAKVDSDQWVFNKELSLCSCSAGARTTRHRRMPKTRNASSSAVRPLSSAVERIWHRQDSQSQILPLAESGPVFQVNFFETSGVVHISLSEANLPARRPDSAKARIWPRLSCTCHICSAMDQEPPLWPSPCTREYTLANLISFLKNARFLLQPLPCTLSLQGYLAHKELPLGPYNTTMPMALWWS